MSLFVLRSFIKAQKTQELYNNTAECSLRLIMYEGCSKSFEPLQEAVELGPSYSLRIFSHLYDED